MRRKGPGCMYLALLMLISLTGDKSAIGSTRDNPDTLRINAVFETIRSRRTVREFQSTPVPSEHITQILDAARFAPTAGNVQPWKFVVIQQRTHLDSLARTIKSSWSARVSAKSDLDEELRESYIKNGHEAIDRIMMAPVYVMAFVDTSVYPKYALLDGCLAIENLMVAARAMGYGTGFFTTYFPEDVVKSFVHAPDNLQFICATPIDIPKEWPETPPKKNLDDFIIYESFEIE
jgi:nitroreductase